MNEALFIKDGDIKKITANQIESRTEYVNKYNGYLFCPTQGCDASLTFALTPTFATKKIFKTARHSEHSENCPHRIVHTGSSLHRYSSETINQELSDEHKRDVLKKLYERNFEDESTNMKPKSKPGSKPRPNPEAGSIARPVASIDPDAVPVTEGQREPSVRKRKSNDILPEDIGQLRGIDGKSLSAKIDDNSIEIWLNPNLSILFFNAFRDASLTAYQQVLKIANDINSNSLTTLICCIGIIEEAKHGYQIQIMDPSMVSFDNKSAYNFYAVGQEV